MYNKENTVEIHNKILPVLSEMKAIPKNQIINVNMNKQLESIWYDWFRILLWAIIPEEATLFKLSLNTNHEKKLEVSDDKTIDIYNIKTSSLRDEESNGNKLTLKTEEIIDNPFGDEKEFNEFLEI